MKRRNMLADLAIEIGTGLCIGYVTSRFMRVAIARGNSMLPTIKNNQPILLDCRKSRFHTIRRHDLVAFRAHQKNQPKIFLKRVIALPGEEVTIKNKSVYINGVLLDEPYLNETMKYQPKLSMMIPEGCLFVMGDNRNHSLDSRHTKLGVISINNDVVGVVKQFKK